MTSKIVPILGNHRNNLKKGNWRVIMITYSSIGLCQCCGVEGSVCECSNCHLQVGLLFFKFF